MLDKLLYLRSGRLEAVEGVPEFQPLVMPDSIEDWTFEVVGYQDLEPYADHDYVDDYYSDVVGYELRRFGDSILTDAHPRVMPKGGKIGESRPYMDHDYVDDDYADELKAIITLLRKTATRSEWVQPQPHEADAEPAMSSPSEDGLYYVSNADGQRFWGTGTSDPPLTFAQFKKLTIIMEFTQ